MRFCQLEAAAAAFQRKFKEGWQRIITRMQLLRDASVMRAARQKVGAPWSSKELARALQPLAQCLGSFTLPNTRAARTPLERPLEAVPYLL